MRFAVFWRISVRFCGFRTPLTPPSQWFGINGMITNPDKYQAMILGNTNYTFSFTVKDTNIPVKDDILTS